LRSKESNSAWPLRSRDITLLHHYYGPLRHPAAVQPFSCVHSYRAYLLPRISPRGIQDFSSFCRVPVTVSPPLPRRCELPFSQLEVTHAVFADFRAARPSETNPSLTRLAQRSLTLQPGNSLASPRLTLSVGFSMSIALHAATRARRLLALTAVGLPPYNESHPMDHDSNSSGHTVGSRTGAVFRR
jgi:hypothetical protein